MKWSLVTPLDRWGKQKYAVKPLPKDENEPGTSQQTPGFAGEQGRQGWSLTESLLHAPQLGGGGGAECTLNVPNKQTTTGTVRFTPFTTYT